MNRSFVRNAFARACYVFVALLLAMGIVGCAQRASDGKVISSGDDEETSEETNKQDTQEGTGSANADKEERSDEEEEREPYVLHFNNYDFTVPDEWRDKVELRDDDSVVIGRKGLYFEGVDSLMILGFEDYDTYDWTHRDDEYQPRLLGDETTLKNGNRSTDFEGLDKELGVWVRGNGHEAVLTTNLYTALEFGAYEGNGVFSQEDLRIARDTMASLTGLPETTDSRTLTETYLRKCAEFVTFPDEAPTKPVQDSGIPNIDDPEVHEKLNAFLSNFSEGYFCAIEGEQNTFDRDNATATQWVDLTFMNYLQNYGKGEDCDETLDDEWYNYRLPVEKLDATADHLCGRTADDWSDVNSENNLYMYKDGYMYTQITNGYLLCGPSVATSVEPYGDGTIRVEFDAYHQFAEETGYSLEGESLYGLSESEINARLGVEGPSRSGVAILEATYYTPPAASGWGFKLVHYELD